MPARIDIRWLGIATCLLAAPGQAAEALWPDAQAIERAREAHPFPKPERLLRVPVPALPRLTPAPTTIDIADVVRRHSQLQAKHPAAPATPPAPVLRVFVTLAMPQASLRLLTEQAERTGATLVLRGLKAHSMKQTLAAVQALVGERRVNWQIDPEAFVRYGVQHAPAFVLTAAPAAGDSNCGVSCSVGQPYYSVAGDVSLDYALNTLQRRHPEAGRHAMPFLQRLRNTP